MSRRSERATCKETWMATAVGRRWRPLAIVAAVAAFAGDTPAMANDALAKKNECFACHSAAKAIVGPAYRDVAARYAGQSGAEDLLVKSIREGSSGKWGDIPMPAHPKLSDADAHRLAKWILGSAP
jgi:cytochrome c